MKLQLHKSGLEQLSKCGVFFERRYLLGERFPSTISQAIGTATDASVNADLVAKCESGELLSVEAVQDVARDIFEQEWQTGLIADGESENDGKGAAVDSTVSLAALHRIELAPKISPISAAHIQRQWVLDVDGLGIQLAGTIDIQEPDSVRDTKTSAKTPGQAEADNSLQLTMYAMALHALGEPTDKVALDYLVRLKKPRALTLTSRRTLDDFDHLLERVAAAERVVSSGVFAPAPLDSWWCSAKWCPAHATCPYARRPVSMPSPDLTQALSDSLVQIRKEAASHGSTGSTRV
jgi:hypothetical protein